MLNLLLRIFFFYLISFKWVIVWAINFNWQVFMWNHLLTSAPLRFYYQFWLLEHALHFEPIKFIPLIEVDDEINLNSNSVDSPFQVFIFQVLYTFFIVIDVKRKWRLISFYFWKSTENTKNEKEKYKVSLWKNKQEFLKPLREMK